MPSSIPACIRQFPNLVRIPDIFVEAVVHWPFAAWPQGSPGMYDIDEEHMVFMNKALATEEGTADYIRDFVESYDDLDSYLDLIGRDENQGAVARQLQLPARSLSPLDLDARGRRGLSAPEVAA